jgi:adenylate cyclase
MTSLTATIKKTYNVGTIVGIVWCLFAAAVIYYSPQFCDAVNNKFYDWKLSLVRPPKSAPEIVHLDVDDRSVTELGQWPWDRSMSAKILKRLESFGAKAAVFDILYSSAGRSAKGNQAFFNAIKNSSIFVGAVSFDATLKKEVKLKVDIDRSRADALYDRCWIMNIPKQFPLMKARRLKNSQLPLKQIIELSPGMGHINATPDKDGVHRRFPFLIKLEDRVVPSLSLAALKVYWNLKPENIVLSENGELEITHEGQVTKIPLDDNGMMVVNWGRIWKTFEHFSVAELLSDEPDKARESRYKGKIVVVGVTFTAATDVGVTPRDVHSPLSRIHSHGINTILQNAFIIRIHAVPYLVLLALVIALSFVWAANVMRLKVGIICAVLICIVSILCSILCFVGWRYELPVTEFFFIFSPSAFAVLSIGTFSVELRAYRASRALERYLSPDLLDSIVVSGEDLDLSTKRRELTVVFVDIVGFSTISETVHVDYLNQFLNDFFDRMTQTIFEHKGTIDKFLGDGILAFFGDPVPMENHALAAVKASLDMQKQMTELDSQWSKSGIPEFKTGLKIRIGINTGPVVVGNIGSTRRLEYTVLGSSVNIASRLQALAPPGGIIMAVRTKSLIPNEVPTEGPEFVRVKGIDRDIEVYKIYPEAVNDVTKS